MAIFYVLSNLYISLTRELLRKLNLWKRSRLNLTRNFNNISFVKSALQLNVIPKGFRKKVNVNCHNPSDLQEKIAIVLMKSNLKFLYSEQARLKSVEARLRQHLMRKFSQTEWPLILAKIEQSERSCFNMKRESQATKLDFLLCERYGRSSDLSRLKEEGVPGLSDGGRTIVDRESFVNLSSKSLDVGQISLLNKGLEFIPYDSKDDLLTISVEVELSALKLGLKDDSFPKLVRQTFQSPNLREQDNLSSLERVALHNLRKDDSIIILPSDKGKVCVLLDKVVYEEKLLDVVLGGDYVVLKKDPSVKIDNKIRKIASNVKKYGVNLPKNFYHLLVSHFTRHPSVYGLPKLHKSDIPLRIIVSSFDTVTSTAAIFCAKILTELVMEGNDIFMIKNIYEFKDSVKQLDHASDEWILASLDVVNMYGCILPSVGLEVVREFILGQLNFCGRFSLKAEDFLELVEVVLMNSYFKLGEEFFAQSVGIPMGSNLSPIVADLVMMRLEKKLSNLEGFRFVKLLKRYRDDYGLVWSGGLGRLFEFFEDINTLDSHLKFTLELEKDKKLAFLDAKMERVDNLIKFRLFSKPFASGTVLNFNSFQDISIKRSVVIGETLRYGKISDSPEEDWKILRDILLKNDYPLRFVCKYMAIGKSKLNSSNSGGKSKDRREQILVLPYAGKRKASKLKNSAKLFGIKPVFKKRRNLKTCFSYKFKMNNQIQAGGVYEVKCNCGDVYVGETGGLLDKRMYQHKQCMRNLDLNNGIAAHSIDCDQGIRWDDVNFVEREKGWLKRKITESLYIQKVNPQMNLAKGFNLVGKWN